MKSINLVRPRSGGTDRKSTDLGRRPVVGPLPVQPPHFSSRAGARREVPAPGSHAAAQAASGLPEGLQTVMEAMSGFSLADVVVHRNSAEPSRLGAAAFTQGNQIHVAPGQEQHLPHEAWHVVQQKQGRVKPTLQMKKVAINDEATLEREADLMGARAAAAIVPTAGTTAARAKALASGTVVQCKNGKGKGKVTSSPPDVADTSFKQHYSSATPDPNSTAVGGGPQAVDFIVRGGEQSSHHHIFPKSKLTGTAAELSKWQVAAAATLAEVAADAKKSTSARAFSSDVAQRLTRLATMITGKNRRIGINVDGTWGAKKTSHYYWLGGNLFRGVNCSYRLDDPGDKEETVRPLSFPAERFAAALKWGRATVALEGQLSKLGTSFSYSQSYSTLETAFDTFLENRSDLEVPMHVTSDKIGQDWTLRSGTSAAQYVVLWGSGGHQYQLNKTAGNKFEALSRHLEEAAKEMTLRVRRALPDTWRGRMNGLLVGPSAQLGADLVTAYDSASDASEHDPATVYAGIVDLVSALAAIRNDGAAWLVLTNANEHVEFAERRKLITDAKAAYQRQYAGLV